MFGKSTHLLFHIEHAITSRPDQMRDRCFVGLTIINWNHLQLQDGT